MKLQFLFTAILNLLVFSITAQNNSNEVLFTVDGNPVYTTEFLRVYNKNLDLVQDESQKELTDYLKLFTNYKLKLKEARALDLHTKPSYINELASYQKQLANSYMKDTQVTDALVKEAYQRILYDINASHILIKLSEDASPKDTLIAYNQIIKLRERTLNEGFEKVREEVHNGQTIYGEKLGYFSAFKMVYNFENAAYNTPVGNVSLPFRTRFGYHIINVLDKRKSKGERTVAHIMLLDNNIDSLAISQENKIQELYKKLNQGDDFEALAKQFSEDKNSAPKGGMLQPFTTGQLNVQEFEDVTFSLQEIGDISKPFKTRFGWHIVKLFDKKVTPEFDIIKPELVEKIKRDDRSKVIDQAVVNKLKSQYNINNIQPALPYFESILNENYFKRTWELPANFYAEKPLIKIGDKQLLYKDFGNYLFENQRKTTNNDDYKFIIQKAYESFLDNNVIAYHEANLENENEEFAHIVNEYREGLLLFELMESTIWNTSKTDSVEVQTYYNNNKNKYVLPKRVDAVVASAAKHKTLKKVSKLIERGMALEKIKSLINSNDKIEVVFSEGEIEEGHQWLPKAFELKKGLSKIYKHNTAFVLVKVNDIFEETQKSFEEAKGMVLNDYQNFKEENWIEELREKYPIIINEAALQNVKNQIKSNK